MPPPQPKERSPHMATCKKPAVKAKAKTVKPVVKAKAKTVKTGGK